jgi:hypothetical protein
LSDDKATTTTSDKVHQIIQSITTRRPIDRSADPSCVEMDQPSRPGYRAEVQNLPFFTGHTGRPVIERSVCQFILDMVNNCLCTERTVRPKEGLNVRVGWISDGSHIKDFSPSNRTKKSALFPSVGYPRQPGLHSSPDHRSGSYDASLIVKSWVKRDRGPLYL